MPQPVSSPITSTPSVPAQPYDPVAEDTAPWVKLERNAGPANISTGRVTGEFPDDGQWRQT